VVIIEDLIDTGNTLAWLLRHISTKDPLSVRLCVLLDKVSRRTTQVKCDYVGYECPGEALPCHPFSMMLIYYGCPI
jgi:hypoxanthine-guanine phosphoribosyltransferase